MIDHKRAISKRRTLKHLWLSFCRTIIRPDEVTLHVTSDEEKVVSTSQIPKANVAVIRNGVEALKILPKRDYLPQGKMRHPLYWSIGPDKRH